MKFPEFLKKAEADVGIGADEVKKLAEELVDAIEEEGDRIIGKTTSDLAADALAEFDKVMAEAKAAVDDAVSKLQGTLPDLRAKLTGEGSAITAMVAKIDARLASLADSDDDAQTAATVQSAGSAAPAAAVPASGK